MKNLKIFKPKKDTLVETIQSFMELNNFDMNTITNMIKSKKSKSSKKSDNVSDEDHNSDQQVDAQTSSQEKKTTKTKKSTKVKKSSKTRQDTSLVLEEPAQALNETNLNRTMTRSQTNAIRLNQTVQNDAKDTEHDDDDVVVAKKKVTKKVKKVKNRDNRSTRK